MPWVWADGLQYHAVDTLSCSSSATSSLDADFVPCCSQDLRIGEADNPGPVDQFENLEMDSYAPATTSFVRIGCSNACGLRGKESLALQLGSGIWCLSETHLTLAAQRSVSSTFSQFGQRLNRRVRTHFGAPVAFRSNSTTAGTWSGVGVISDFPSREVMLAMQHGERSSGRLVVTRHLVHQLPVMVASCYGFPQGPTWPDSRNLIKQLLASLTCQFAQPMVLYCRKCSEMDYISVILLTMTGTK